MFLPWITDCGNLQAVGHKIRTPLLNEYIPATSSTRAPGNYLTFYSTSVTVRAINKIGRLYNKHPLSHIALLSFLQTPSCFFDVSLQRLSSFQNVSSRISLLHWLNSLCLSLPSPNNPVSIVCQSKEGYSSHVYISLFKVSSGKFKDRVKSGAKAALKTRLFYSLHDTLKGAGTILFTTHTLYLLSSLLSAIQPQYFYCNSEVQ